MPPYTWPYIWAAIAASCLFSFPQAAADEMTGYAE